MSVSTTIYMLHNSGFKIWTRNHKKQQKITHESDLHFGQTSPKTQDFELLFFFFAYFGYILFFFSLSSFDIAFALNLNIMQNMFSTILPTDD